MVYMGPFFYVQKENKMPKVKLKSKEIQRNAKMDEADEILNDIKNDVYAGEEKATKFSEAKALLDQADVLKVEIKQDQIDEDEFIETFSRLDKENQPMPSKTRTGKVETSSIKTKDVVLEDPKRGFESLADVAQCAYAMAHGQGFDPRLRVLADMNQGDGNKGGFLVPPTFGRTIWQGMQQNTTDLWGRTDNFPVEGESLTFPAIDEKSRQTTIRGGVRAYWLAEANQKIQSDPSLRQVKVEPQELVVYTEVTDKLLNNSPFAVEQFISVGAMDAIGFELSCAVVDGSGAGKPLGFLRSTALLTIAAEGGQGAATILAANIEKMFARFPMWMLSGATWICNQTIMPQLNGLLLGDKPIYLPGGTIEGAPFGTLKGLPIIFTEFAKTLGAVGDISLVNLGAYFSGTQAGGVNADRSIHFRFDTNKTAFRWVTAVDGKPWISSPLTPKNGDTLSPFVTLAAR